MAKYKCIKCNYQTNNKTHFDDHLNRKIPCNINKQHKLIKNNNIHHCKECNKYFSRKDSLTRHNKTFHTTGNENIINPKIDGSNNNLTQNNIDTQNNAHDIETLNNIHTQNNNIETLNNIHTQNNNIETQNNNDFSDSSLETSSKNSKNNDYSESESESESDDE